MPRESRNAVERCRPRRRGVFGSCSSELRPIDVMNLCECNLQAQGATHLAASLHKCPLLTAVNLSDNAIGDDGMTELAKVLPVNTSLTSLNLSRCVFLRTVKSSVTGVLLPVSVCAHAFDHLMQYEHSDVLDAFVRSQQERDWCTGG